MKLKKIHTDWSPSENRELKIGEAVEITDYIRLVKQGMAVLVDESGNELPLPGEVFTCPICYKKTESLQDFTSHVGATHSPIRPNVTLATAPEDRLIEKPSDEEIREKRIAALEKARAVKAANAAK